MALILASVAQASAIRTFVSFAGQDSNTSVNCSIANPCRTFAAAYSVTLPGGEIYAVNPVGYGGLTITGPVTIVGADVAGVNAFANTTGITINAGPTDMVVLRNLQINGNGAANTTGIALNSGRLVLENSVLTGLTTGLIVTGTHADVVNTSISGNTTGIQTNGAGVPYNSGIGLYLISACPCATLVRISGGSNIDNITAFNENNPTSSGGQPSAAIWVFGVSSNNVTGYTNLLTTSGTGAGGNLNPQTYSLGSVPN